MPTPTAGQPEQGPSLADAANVFEGLLDREDGNPDPKDVAAEEAPAETDEGVAAEAKPEETPEEPGADEAEAADADEKPEETDTKQPQMVTVTIDGKAETVPLEEALQGYQRHRDYSRKTAELANNRRQLEEHAKAVLDERQQYATMLVALRDQLQTAEPEPDWDAVYQADPVGYARRRDEWRDKQDKVAAANFELQRLQSVQQQQNAESLAKIVQKGRARMLEMKPDWKDQKVWETDRQAIVAYATRPEIGYTPEEIAQAYDPRAIVVMDKARRYDELMAQKPKPDAVKGPRVASAGAAPAAGASARLNAAQQRLAKSGRIADAAKVFEQFL